MTALSRIIEYVKEGKDLHTEGDRRELLPAKLIEKASRA